MLIEYNKHRALIWRLIPILSCIIWIFNHTLRYFILSENNAHDLLVHFPNNTVIGIIAVFYILVLLLVFSHNFYIHAANFLLFGLYRIVDGGVIDAIAILLLSFTFFYRQGFFNSYIRIKILAGIVLLLTAFVSHIRFGWHIFVENTLEIIEFGLILFILVIFLREEWLFLQKKQDEMILHLPSDIFTDKDVYILEKIILGEKYDTIARETGQAVSTLKKHIHKLFDKLQVDCRISFMSLYANHKVMLKKADKA